MPTRSTIVEPINRELSRAKCVVVLWSSHAVESMWVREQATIGRDRGIVVPVFLERVDLQFGFHDINTYDLSTWNGESQAVEFQRIIDDIVQLVSAAPRPRVGRNAESRIGSAVGQKRGTGPSEKIFLCYRRDDAKLRREGCTTV